MCRQANLLRSRSRCLAAQKVSTSLCRRWPRRSLGRRRRDPRRARPAPPGARAAHPAASLASSSSCALFGVTYKLLDRMPRSGGGGVGGQRAQAPVVAHQPDRGLRGAGRGDQRRVEGAAGLLGPVGPVVVDDGGAQAAQPLGAAWQTPWSSPARWHARASWMIGVSVPPAPPVTSSRCPGCSCSASSAWRPVGHRPRSAPASTGSSRGGRCVACAAMSSTRSAQKPLPPGSGASCAKTWSPTAKPLTPGPRANPVPVPSTPSAAGGCRPTSQPSHRCAAAHPAAPSLRPRPRPAPARPLAQEVQVGQSARPRRLGWSLRTPAAYPPAAGTPRAAALQWASRYPTVHRPPALPHRGMNRGRPGQCRQVVAGRE
jgi:hypothetical protein